MKPSEEEDTPYAEANQLFKMPHQERPKDRYFTRGWSMRSAARLNRNPPDRKEAFVRRANDLRWLLILHRYGKLKMKISGELEATKKKKDKQSQQRVRLGVGQSRASNLDAVAEPTPYQSPFLRLSLPRGQDVPAPPNFKIGQRKTNYINAWLEDSHHPPDSSVGDR
ncbi:hypothetical protein FNV43_RR26540 [Rhamnella rubrinervis]|uniref:Uncharacterized protein n=1 Tax=Rhamnella rubrinervis TaxID=2594499 RepID=A0A8K0DPA3_9ROSA|nr:hypothetical protein FNV43_RR26540 [Rhamnella rubrinervis]